MVTKAFKIHCKSLTTIKRAMLLDMCTNYAEVYNYLSQFLRSLDCKKYTSPYKQSYLYTKYVTGQEKIGGVIDKKLPSNYIVIVQNQLLANFKANGGKFTPTMETPNIIIFDDVKIIKNKNTFFAIIPAHKKYNEQIVLPLNIGDWEEANEYLAKLIDDKCPQVLYNYNDNTISISETKLNERKRKKIDIETIIGIDRGINNIIVLSALNRKKEVIGVKIFNGAEYEDHIRRTRIQQNILKSKEIDINDKVANITETTLRQIAFSASEWIMQFPNPTIIFENLQMKKSKVRQKHGGKSGKILRKKLNRWSYNKIKMMILQKVVKKGIYDPLEKVGGLNPAYTSQFCNRCGAMGVRDSIHFGCPKCGLGFGSTPKSAVGQYNADVNGSINIAKKGFYSLYEKRKRTVSGLKDRLDENPKDKSKNLSAYWIGKYESESHRLDETQKNSDVNVDTHLLGSSAVNDQVNALDSVADCVPENSQISSPYKGDDNFPVRTKYQQKIDISEVLVAKQVLMDVTLKLTDPILAIVSEMLQSKF